MKQLGTLAMVFAACVGLILNSQAQDPAAYVFNARVYPDSSKPAIAVKDAQIEFIFAGYGAYLPSEYPLVRYFPLENGEHISFASVAEVQCRPRRVQWKKFIEPAQRRQYPDVDEAGYRHWSDIEIDILLKDWNGLETRSRIQRPEVSDVFIIGKTDRGAYRLQLDQENGKTVRIEFEPLFIMQCSSDLNHLFPNVQWRFCPLCGASLKKISKAKQP